MREKQPCKHHGQCKGSCRCRTEAPCSPRRAHGGAGCPPAACGCHAEQISMCSHGGAYDVAVDEAWRSLEPPQEKPWAEAATHREEPMVRQEGWRDPCWRNPPLGLGPVVQSHVGAVLGGTPAWGHFGKDDILWEGFYMEEGKGVTMKDQQQQALWSDCSPHCLFSYVAWDEVEEGGTGEGGCFCLVLVLTALTC